MKNQTYMFFLLQVCEAVDSVTTGGYTRVFCAVRPPGHHVGRLGRTKNVPSQGFCLLNNVAVGAKYALLTAGFQVSIRNGSSKHK
jgi:acetoin utilization deacetylase AcuC-like enzyme